jgi:phospholipid/cholesterol/gamma-HCH transport system substrate-binding protein
MLGTPEFKVGALVVVVSALIGVMSMKVNEGPGFFGSSRSYWFNIPDADGLVANSAVKAAGIKVGVIDKIKYVDGAARIYVVVEGDFVMRRSGSVELKSSGILGDRHVEMNPGNLSDPELEDGAQILSASDQGSMQSLMNQLGKIGESLNTLAATINKATGPEGDRSTSLGRIVNNIEKLTADLADMSGANKTKINAIVDQVNSITKQLDGFISDDSPEGFKAGWEKVTSSLHRIESTLKNVDEIAAKINNGQGTIGRLVNDEETIEKVNETLTGINEFVGGAVAMETGIDFHTEVLGDVNQKQSFLNFRLQPGLDRYYEVGIVDDPRGVESRSRMVQTGTTTSDVQTVSTSDKVKFTVLFAKNFHNLTIKGGLIESSGGLGVDYFMLDRNLRFSVEYFDFDNRQLRAFARYNIFKGLYLIGGGDDLTNREFRSSFFGAGIFLTNDDLKFFANRINL